MDVSTTDDFTRGVDALVYEINEAESLMTLTYPVDLFDRNITDGPAMLNMPRCTISGCRRIICAPLTALRPRSAICGGCWGGHIRTAVLSSTRLSNRNWTCARSPLPTPAIISGWAAISSKAMNPKAIRTFRRCATPSAAIHARLYRPCAVENGANAGGSGIRTGTMSFGKMEGETSDKLMAL